MKTVSRIALMFLLIHALMNGVFAAAFTAIGEEGQSGLISQAWGKLKNSVLDMKL